VEFFVRKPVTNVPIHGKKPETGLSGADAARFFGPPPLFVGEDQAQYEAMRDQISAAVGPLDFLEEIWVNDVLNLVWEIQRLRRLKAALLQANAHRGVNRIMMPLLGIGAAADLANQWAAREPKAIKHVEDILKEAGLTMEAVKAETLVVYLDDFERIERLIASAEARRDACLREIDRHRSSLAEALRQTAEEMIDGEFEEIPPPEAEGQAA
jgi:hypothetical protein